MIKTLATRKAQCEKCHGTGSYMYDELHGKICEFCCLHNGGWVKIQKYWGKDNGKYACKLGCGFVISQPKK